MTPSGPITWNALFADVPVVVRTVVLDAGHGGHDPGAVSNGRWEKDDVLRLALAVRNLLQAQGIRVVMTRSTDIFVPLTERSATANRNNADLFVSIHRNASEHSTANGVENFIYTSAPANTENAASLVLAEVVAAGVQRDRGLKRGNFSVLRHTSAPAMLLELGFITNTRDNQLFDQNFNAYAAAITRGIMRWF
ncbi:MAG: N-acetylmuramoyl-L-alanine amidase [Defluviitaleaceae bacterium]|nr:N-acetylmuramoyl-L-alanine amidase [Defluviitaleaceae bacterium]MCL2275331.1 N-acetylmuramoyl-L-alanine amidase [Defluviitaleaceae bacterium]